MANHQPRFGIRDNPMIFILGSFIKNIFKRNIKFLSAGQLSSYSLHIYSLLSYIHTPIPIHYSTNTPFLIPLPPLEILNIFTSSFQPSTPHPPFFILLSTLYHHILLFSHHTPNFHHYTPPSMLPYHPKPNRSLKYP